jgi:hypothetical protein
MVALYGLGEHKFANRISDFAAVFWRDLAMPPVEPIMADQLVWLPCTLFPRGGVLDDTENN